MDMSQIIQELEISELYETISNRGYLDKVVRIDRNEMIWLASEHNRSVDMPERIDRRNRVRHIVIGDSALNVFVMKANDRERIVAEAIGAEEEYQRQIEEQTGIKCDVTWICLRGAGLDEILVKLTEIEGLEDEDMGTGEKPYDHIQIQCAMNQVYTPDGVMLETPFARTQVIAGNWIKAAQIHEVATRLSNTQAIHIGASAMAYGIDEEAVEFHGVSQRPRMAFAYVCAVRVCISRG